MAKEKDNKVKNENKHFMKDVKAELKKVTWPSSKQMVNNVTAVIVIVLVTAAIVFCLDFVFGAINKYGVDKLKEHVQKKQSQSQVIDTVPTSTENNNENANNKTENAGNNENTSDSQKASNNN